MELKNMFPNIDGMWVRWSDYRLTEFHGVEYIIPTENATSLSYSCTEHLNDMIVDALNLGRQVAEGQSNGEACLAFARKYGPMGVVSQTVKNPLLRTGNSTDNTVKNVSPVYNDIFAKGYGEQLERYQDTLCNLYLHFLAINSGEHRNEQEQTAEPCGMSYRLTAGANPQLVWQPDNLLAVLKLGYAIAITDTATPLKVCKHCGKVYYNPNARSEFCSVKCRNHYNVIAFRGRKMESN
ncbi:MAG: hypothetical protein RR423_02960 [Hydrogenoanaerobacterium sp.]